MKDSIRCCISCILPCGALDVIRIVHASGRVEEISRTVCAGGIMQAYPKHVLRKPPPSSSPYGEDGGCGDSTTRRGGALVLPPSAKLQRGKIYFLMPVSSSSSSSTAGGSAAARRRRRKKRVDQESHGEHSSEEDRTRLLLSDRYLSEILSEKVSTQRDRRRGRVGVWRPHLESIEEIINTNDL